MLLTLVILLPAAGQGADEAKPAADIPKGEVRKYSFDQSKIFPGTVRDYWVYVPKQVDRRASSGDWSRRTPALPVPAIGARRQVMGTSTPGGDLRRWTGRQLPGQCRLRQILEGLQRLGRLSAPDNWLLFRSAIS
jgi:hypothetical protein